MYRYPLPGVVPARNQRKLTATGNSNLRRHRCNYDATYQQPRIDRHQGLSTPLVDAFRFPSVDTQRIGTLPEMPVRSAPLSVANRPAIPVVIAFVMGIAAHAAAPAHPTVYLLLMGATLVVARQARRRPLVVSGCIALATALGGLVTAQLFAFYYPRDHIAAYATDDPHPAWLELHVDQPPRVLTNPFDHRHAMPPKQVTSATVTRVKTWDGWVDASGEVLVQIGQPHPTLAAGQTVRVLGMLQRPAPAMNPGQFDWEHYYRDQRVLVSFSIPHAGTVELLRDDGPGPLGWARQKVRRLLAMGFPADRALDHALLRALLVGDHDPQLRDVQEQFQQTGTSHHLAVSGMHVAVLGGVVFLLCRLLCLRPRWSVGISLAFVLAYGAMALPQPPVIRAVALSVAVGVGLLMRRQQDRLQLLAAAAVAMLLYRPLDIESAGFQLSFLCVLGLMLFTRPTLRFFESFRDRDVELAETLQPQTAMHRLRRRLSRTFLFTVATGLVAWWVSMPLIAYHFEQLKCSKQRWPQPA